MPHVASTLTNSTKYTHYDRLDDGRVVEKASVTVKGGFGLADKNFVTPTGAVMTSVTDDELDLLQKHSHFKEHAKAGFVKVYAKATVDGEKAAADMKLGDGSQPLNPGMFAEKNKDKLENLSVSTANSN